MPDYQNTQPAGQQEAEAPQSKSALALAAANLMRRLIRERKEDKAELDSLRSALATVTRKRDEARLQAEKYLDMGSIDADNGAFQMAWLNARNGLRAIRRILKPATPTPNEG